MGIRIRIPMVLVRAWDRFEDWGDITLWQRGRLEIRRIDIVLAASFVFCVGTYWVLYGWRGAVAGAAGFTLMATIAMMVRS